MMVAWKARSLNTKQQSISFIGFPSICNDWRDRMIWEQTFLSEVNLKLVEIMAMNKNGDVMLILSSRYRLKVSTKYLYGLQFCEEKISLIYCTKRNTVRAQHVSL